MGREIAIQLASEGANLGLMSRSRDQLQETAKICESNGAKTMLLPVDATDVKSVEKMHHSFIQNYQNLDILVLCQGISYNRTLFVDDQEDKWRRVLETNLLSCMHLTRLSLPYLIKNKETSHQRAIIIIASIAGKQASAGSSAYCASKFGLVGFGHALFEEIREYGIKVSILCPGYINTEMVNSRKNLIPEKMIQPKDIAQIVSEVIHTPITTCPVELIIRPQYSPVK